MSSLRDQPLVASFLQKLRHNFEQYPYVVRAESGEIVSYRVVTLDVILAGGHITVMSALEMTLEQHTELERMELAREIVRAIPQAHLWLGDYFNGPLNAEGVWMFASGDTAALIQELPQLQGVSPVEDDLEHLGGISDWVIVNLLKPDITAELWQPLGRGLSGPGLTHQREVELRKAREAHSMRLAA